MSAGRYIVTGAGGFIGARTVEALRTRRASAGADLVSVDFLETFARPEHAGVDFGQKVEPFALLPFLERETNATRIDAIIHLGACSDTMELDEAVFSRLNLEYTKALWSFAAQREIPFVYASSAATYGAGERGYVDDESKIDGLEPLNPYGWSKQRFDLWALAEEKAGRRPPRWAGFKFFNVYGFGERHKGRMASVVLHGFEQIRKDAKIGLFKSYKDGIGDGEQRRDFVYVDDVVDVLLFAAGGESGHLTRGIYNLGTGRARTFADLARATFAGLKLPANIEFVEMPEALRGRYQYFTEADMTKLVAAGYTRPPTSLEDGVAAYVARLQQNA